MRKIGLLAWLGMVPVWAGEMPQKAAGYHAALVNRPESAQLFERFRDAWLEERSVDDLEKELLARAEAGEAGAWATLGRAYMVAGKTEQALAAFDKAREQLPVAWLALETARLRLAAKDFAAAEKDALAVPEGDSQRLEALKLAGLACLRAERIDAALAHWTKAVEAAPGDTGLLEDLTELTRREGRADLALEYCGKWRDATKDAYGKAMATLRRSELLLGSQRFDEAMTELAAVIDVSADDSWLEREALARAEQAHRQRGNATGWAAWIGAKAEAHPSRLNLRRTQAQALAAAGKADEALDVLTEVMKRSPGDTAVRWLRIDLLEQAMKLPQAYDECAELAAKEKSETAGLRWAELAFRLEKKDELKRALDGVLAAAEPAKRVGLAGLYARYGLPEGSERIWREEAGGEQGGQALRLLAKHLKTEGREQDAIDVWKQIGTRQVAQDRMEAAQMLAAAGERSVAREILMGGRGKFSAEPGYEAALADLAMADEKAEEARAIYLALARGAKRPDELTAAVTGWLRASAAVGDPLKDLGEETADRCLRAAWLATAGEPMPAVRDGDALERPVRMTLLRGQGRWAEVVAMMEAVPGERGPLVLSELAEAKTAAGDLAGALAAAQAWRARVPDQAGPWLFEAGILEKLGKRQDATVLLRRAAARFEDNEDVAKRLFVNLQESLDPREALAWAWKRHDRSQEESVRSGWLREILQVSKEREQLDDLQASFEERARRDPASPGPLVALAELAKARGDSRAELDLLRRAAVNAPRDKDVISALAALEEQSGETARALERFIGLARLAPGPESARQLAQAKIRLGDIEGGMRDMQALAGEKGLDLRALEQCAGDLAARGYVEEATRMLAAVAPAQRTARLDFVLGMLLDIDGREREAADAFMRVMAEPDDPAENPQRAARGYDGSSRTWQINQLFQNSGERDDSIPGTFTNMQVPQSLVDAKRVVISRLLRLALEQGGEVWQKAVAVIPELVVATPEQWREVMDLVQSGVYGHELKWWDFIQTHPGNPLGAALLVEYGQVSYGKPEQVEALLKTNPPMRIQLQLRQGNGVWRTDTLEFLESIKSADWQDESVRVQALRMVEGMFSLACRDGVKTPPAVTVAECARGLAVLDKAGLVAPVTSRLEVLRARLALLEDKPDEFVRLLNAWWLVAGKLALQQFPQAGTLSPTDTFEFWRKKSGDAAAEALVTKIESPVLRCQLSRDTDTEHRLARINRELAALPQDAPVETRRALTRMKWSYQQRGNGISEAFRKELEAAAADVSDPRMALEAHIALIYDSRGGEDDEGGLTDADRLKLEALVNKLMVSPDEADREYAAQFDGYFGRSSGRSRGRSQPVATRWGTSASFSNNGYRQNRLTLPAIIAMTDRELAVREAARYLESLARGAAGRVENFNNDLVALSNAKLLDGALERISLPADAGLGRRVAFLNLLDACGKTDRARDVLEETAKMRPWETRWTVDLALRAPDDAEMRRLLDNVAERGDFDRALGGLLAPRSVVKPDQLLARLNRLAEWAAQAKGRRGWMEPALLMLANGGGGGLPSLAQKNTAQLECFRRYIKLALDDRRLAEFGFRKVYNSRNVETPEVITDAARQVFLSGAYTSTERLLGSSRSHESATLSALEFLVQMAGEKGDDVAFPTEFREQLQAADPVSAAWLGKLLAAKTVAELPDVSNSQAQATGWVALARHDAALLRAVKLPGRDAWLADLFTKNQYQYFSTKLRQVICGSLLDAAKTKRTRERVFAWLEAAAGPRKNWVGKNARNNSQVGNGPANLPQVAALILNSAAESDPATVLGVLDVFREARVPVYDTSSASSYLAQCWQKEVKPPRQATLAELLGNKREAAYTFGVWYPGEDSQGKLRFLWLLPQTLQNIEMSDSGEWVKAVKENPNAGFPDLLRAWSATSDRTLQRRALLKATPDLAKLSVEIRSAVLDVLTEGMHAGDLDGLPAQAAAQLREQLAVESRQRIETVRKTLKTMKSGRYGRHGGGNQQSYQLGSLLGPVIADDDALVTEILTAWQPLAEADKSGKECEAFIGGLISNARQNPRAVNAILRLLDSLWKGSPPPYKQNSNWGDPIESLWSNFGQTAIDDPQLWKQVAALSPKMQARFWLRSDGYADRGDFGTDPKLVKSLREAAQGGEVTRAALEWWLQNTAMRRDENSKADGAVLLGYAKAFKDAGASPTDLAMLLYRNYHYLAKMENPGVLMAETPVLLDGIKTFTDEQGGQFLQGVQNLWQKIQQDRNRAGQSRSEAALPAPVYPVETVALLKFVLPRTSGNARSYYNVSSITPIVLATGDGELFELWVKIAGPSLAGDFALIIALLEKDRATEAVALATAAGSNISFSSGLTSRMEPLVAKLRTVPLSQSFPLILRFSMTYDAYGAEAPAEKKEVRHARLTDEYEHVRSTLTFVQRTGCCLALGLGETPVRKHVPALDEFASEAVAKEYQKLLLSNSIDPSLASLFLPAVCSRVYADDLSGISLLAAAIAAAPQGQAGYDLIPRSISRLQSCLAAYADRHDGKIPQASAEIILTYAKVIADRKNPKFQGIVSHFVHLVATDPASLAAGLKRCGLEGVKPDTNSLGYGMFPETKQSLMRVALLHPFASEVLLDSLGPPDARFPNKGTMLLLLRDPALRAKISPALFLKWNLHLKQVGPQDLEAIKLYATERRGDFDEAQRTALDGLLEGLEKSSVQK